MHIRIAVAAGLLALSTWSLSGQAGKNLIGYCVGLKGLEAAKAAGFDYVELGTTELTALSDADFEAAVAQAKAVGIPTPNANLFLPGTLKLTGPERGHAGTADGLRDQGLRATGAVRRQDPLLRQRRRAAGPGRLPEGPGLRAARRLRQAHRPRGQGARHHGGDRAAAAPGDEHHQHGGRRASRW